MSDPNQDFAEAAVASMQNQNQEQGASSEEGGSEPSEADPLLEYAKVLKAAGIAPESARDFSQKLAYMQTPQGQATYFENFIASEQGAVIRDRFGREYLANMLATSPDKVYQMAQEFGYKPPANSTEDDDGLPDSREMKAIKAQQVALEARMHQLANGAGAEIRDLKTKLQGQEELRSRTDAFSEWTRTVPPMALPAVKAVAKRAHELAILYPDQYRGSIGFKKAASDAHAEFSGNAQYFQPKARPRNSSAGGGGVAGKSVDDSKLTLAQRIENAADEFAENARGIRGGE